MTKVFTALIAVGTILSVVTGAGGWFVAGCALGAAVAYLDESPHETRR